MIFQILLTTLLLVVLIYAAAQWFTARLIAVSAILASLTALYFTWMPNHANLIASRFGIGRGADLILYCWGAISLVLFLNLHLRLRSHLQMITQLSRHIAINNPQTPLTVNQPSMPFSGPPRQ